jgi:hypothetical protein
MRSEEELMVLVLEMEGRIDKLMSVLNNAGKES